MIETVDFHIRLIAIGTSIMLIAQLAAGDVRPRIKMPVIALIIGAIAYLLSTSEMMVPRGPLDPYIELVAISTPFWTWLFARRLFENEPEQRFVYGAAGVLIAGWVIGNFIPSTGRAGFYILHIAALALLADFARIALTDRQDDLVEQRRIIRLWLPALVAAQAGAILLFETVTGASGLFPVVNLVNGILIMLITLFAGLALLRTDPELLVETAEDAPTDDVIPDLDLSPSEQVLHEKLTAAMKEGAFRTPGLTISALAEHLDTPEHRLRALINQRLGHRNFSAFLNRYRVGEAQKVLSSRDHVDLPILTIAMDLGYNSLPPFNRAFREQTGTSPSEYRKRAFVEDPAEPPDFVAAVTGQN